MSLHDNSILESRDAEFFEHVFPMKKLNYVNDVAISGSISVVPKRL